MPAWYGIEERGLQNEIAKHESSGNDGTNQVI